MRSITRVRNAEQINYSDAWLFLEWNASCGFALLIKKMRLFRSKLNYLRSKLVSNLGFLICVYFVLCLYLKFFCKVKRNDFHIIFMRLITVVRWVDKYEDLISRCQLGG